MGDMRVIHLPGHQTLTPSVTRPFQFLITCFSCCHLSHLSSQLWLGCVSPVSSLGEGHVTANTHDLSPDNQSSGPADCRLYVQFSFAKQININKCYQEQSSPGALVPKCTAGTELGAQTRAWNNETSGDVPISINHQILDRLRPQSTVTSYWKVAFPSCCPRSVNIKVEPSPIGKIILYLYALLYTSLMYTSLTVWVDHSKI